MKEKENLPVVYEGKTKLPDIYNRGLETYESEKHITIQSSDRPFEFIRIEKTDVASLNEWV